MNPTQENKLSLYAMAEAANYNASTYYRIILPTWTMHKLGLPIEFSIDQMSAVLQPGDRLREMTSCDFHLAYQSVSPHLISMIKDSRTWPYMKAPDGRKLVPPSFIVDTDDDLFNVHPLNKAYANLGHRDDKGNELPPGEKIWARHPVTNEPQLLWEDGKNVNYALNRQMLENWRETMRMSELITVSTNGCKNMVIREIGEEHANKIYINPNCIDLTEYPKIDLAHKDEVTILYQGSPTHWEDLWDYKVPLGNVIRKYPHARLLIWGIDYKWFLNEMPSAQTDLIPWMDYRLFKLRLSTLGHDICIAPLRDSIFNQCRSAIKWYEGAATWKPAATLAQNSAVFREEIQDGKTGMLFNNPEEFEQKLGELIEDATKRKEIAANAKDWVKDNRDPSAHAIKYFERLQQVRKERLEWPEVKPKVSKNGLSKTKYAHIRKRKNKGVRKH